MTIAMAVLHRAARQLARSGPVTIPRLARATGRKETEIRSCVKRVPGLPRDLDLVPGDRVGLRYVAAIDQMRTAGVHVTYRRIAFATGSTAAAVRMWAMRNPAYARDIITEARYRRLHAARRIASAWEDVRPPTLAALARHLGVERTTLYKVFDKEPWLRQQLGV